MRQKLGFFIDFLLGRPPKHSWCCKS